MCKCIYVTLYSLCTVYNHGRVTLTLLKYKYFGKINEYCQKMAVKYIKLVVIVVVVVVALVEKVIADQIVVKTNKPNENKKNKNQIKEESGLQLGQWSSCCMGPESNVLAIHRLSPLTFNINCIRLKNNFYQNHVSYFFLSLH